MSSQLVFIVRAAFVYFTSEQSCNNRGYAMTTPGHAGYIPGMIAYYCYYTGPKWSMDVLD